MSRRLSNTDPNKVYFVRPIGMDGPIKIGCSKDPETRLKVLSAWSPFPLELIGSVLGEFNDENRLHRRFSELHTRKEWFMSSPLLRQTIERILEGVPIKEACKDLPVKSGIRKRPALVKTPDRELFIAYGHKLREACRAAGRLNRDRFYRPWDCAVIMHNWRTDRTHGHLPITPTKEQFARLDEVIAHPEIHGVSRPWGGSETKKVILTPEESHAAYLALVADERVAA